MNNIKIKLGIALAAIVGALILLSSLMGMVTIKGSEVAVQRDFFKGVLDKTLRDGTHFYLLKNITKYNIGTQKCDFGLNGSAVTNASHGDMGGVGTDYPRIKINVGENGGQPVWISMSINYRIGWENGEAGLRFSEQKLIALHKDGLKGKIEDIIVKRTVVDIVNELARPRMPLEIRGGKGFVKFKNEVESKLKSNDVFARRGIYIENVVINAVELNPEYERMIDQKELAKQEKLKKIEETLVAEQEAKRADALAQIEVKQRTARAEAKKIEVVKNAEAEKAKTVLAAEADKQKKILNAKGLLAEGKALAEVNKLQRDALYAGVSGQRRADVEKAKHYYDASAAIVNRFNTVTEKTILQYLPSPNEAPKITVEN